MIAAADSDSVMSSGGHRPPAIMMNDIWAFNIDPSFGTGHGAHSRMPVADQQDQVDLHAYVLRLEALRAKLAQDGCNSNTASGAEDDSWRFFHSEPFIRKGNPVPMDENQASTLTDFPGHALDLKRQFVKPTFLSLTDSPSHAFDLKFVLAREWTEEIEQAQAVFQAYKSRIEELRAYAVQDGYDLNTASESDFWRFIRSRPFIREGDLALVDNGNLRAVWEGEHDAHFGLQFLGEQIVQYVIFKRRTATGAVSRVAGRDSIEGVIRQIEAFDLRSLIYT